MTCWTKEQLENMLEDVVNELDLSDEMIDEHGPLGTPPAILVRLVLEQKDKQIAMLKAGFVDANCYELAAYANRDELDSILDDRTTIISGVRDGWHNTPIYTMTTHNDKA